MAVLSLEPIKNTNKFTHIPKSRIGKNIIPEEDAYAVLCTDSRMEDWAVKLVTGSPLCVGHSRGPGHPPQERELPARWPLGNTEAKPRRELQGFHVPLSYPNRVSDGLLCGRAAWPWTPCLRVGPPGNPAFLSTQADAPLSSGHRQ